ncbi:MAG: 2,3-bisphosphoglycerate-independent phosphoglycerate mutase [Proteobacteria bacterium]|nr:2,3-bisphosphoglycerate-independent phosphoglycerate mutase [Pseudomonadota bacterium]MBU1740570.1 2,3-bisphosphoglycerate-independent phosphoglycerate mutase [Pseudomonadota bacterium]
MPARCLVILLDGLGDRSFPGLGNQTPLQAARTPNLDDLAAKGINGLFHGGRPGQALSSENAHFTLFGYCQTEFPGRGVFEALGAGINLEPEDVAVLTHLDGVVRDGDRLIVNAHRPRIEPNQAADLFGAVAEFETDEVSVDLHPCGGPDGIIVLRGELSPDVTDTDPSEVGQAIIEPEVFRNAAHPRRARRTAAALKRYLTWAHRILDEHPVNEDRRRQGLPALNFLSTHRAGQLRPVTPFLERWGLRALTISSGLVYEGLGRYLGMDTWAVTDGPDPGRDLAQRIGLAADRLKDYDFIHVHTKAPDQAAHTKDPRTKLAVIEELDQGLGRVLPDLLADPETLVVVTSDHSTPSGSDLIHSGEPVPLAMVGQGVRVDQVNRFDEISAAAGALGLLRGDEFMLLVLNHLDRAQLVGLRQAPQPTPHRPRKRRPFRIEES